jgi:hypothetical protein
MSSVKWSYSSLKDYANCPKQYNEVKILRNFTKKMTPQMLYGSEVHRALENYTKDRTPLPKNYARYQAPLDALLTIDGEVFPEYKMALDANKQPCEFSSKEYWVRGIVDFLAIAEDHAYIVDYKTGSNKYPDPKQLKLMALMTFSHFPEVNTIKAGLLFIAHNSFIDEIYTRSQIDEMWKVFEADLQRLHLSTVNNTWQANPTPLCGWCPVNTCNFHKER